MLPPVDRCEIASTSCSAYLVILVPFRPDPDFGIQRVGMIFRAETRLFSPCTAHKFMGGRQVEIRCKKMLFTLMWVGKKFRLPRRWHRNACCNAGREREYWRILPCASLAAEDSILAQKSFGLSKAKVYRKFLRVRATDWSPRRAAICPTPYPCRDGLPTE